MTRHTNKDFEHELRTLRERLAAMGGRCEQQIKLALRALDDRDDALARQVIDGDQAIDKDESEIDELAKSLEKGDLIWRIRYSVLPS